MMTTEPNAKAVGSRPSSLPGWLVAAGIALIAVAGMIFVRGGAIHPESYHTYLPHYLGDAPFLQKIFDVNVTDAGNYQARELSYVFDWIDCHFIDFCVGPHVPTTGRLKAFKLLSTSNAYWKGDARNQPMQRVYGTAFFTDKELKAYLTQIEEAKKRDHRKVGKELGKTSGWAHRAVLQQSRVTQVSGASYDRIDDAGLHLSVDGEPRVLDVDHVVICAGQESVRGLYDELLAVGREVRIIGGADVAAELDAKRAIEQGVRLAAARR